MEKTLHICSYKNHCRIQIVIGLCLAMLFTFLSVDNITKADDFYQYYWGSYNQVEDPITYFSTVGLSVYDMLDIIYDDDNPVAHRPRMFDREFFDRSISQIGLEPAFTFYDTTNTTYFVNVYYYYTGYYTKGILLLLCKSNCQVDLSDYSLVNLNNGFSSFNSGKPILLNVKSDTECNFLFYRNPLIMNLDNSGSADTFQTRVSSSQSVSFLSSGSVRTAKSYNLTNDSSFSNVVNYFNEFLNNEYMFMSIDLCIDSIGRTTYFTHVGLDCYAGNSYSGQCYFNVSEEYKCPIISNIFVYKKSTNVSIGIDYGYGFRLGSTNLIPPFSTDSSDQIVSYGVNLNTRGVLPTPIPYPTQYWHTPTPFPTYEVNATLTPIAFVNNPDLNIGNGTVFGHLNGVLSLFNQYFYDNPFPKFFGYCADLIYSFSDVFKFFIIVPTIALIAMVIGRLRRK